jgi:hypothetical protein
MCGALLSRLSNPFFLRRLAAKRPRVGAVSARLTLFNLRRGFCVTLQKDKACVGLKLR